MSLADRIKNAQPNANRSNSGCHTCRWWKTTTKETQQLINEWLEAGHSKMELHSILSTPSDDVDSSELLPVTFSAWNNHVKNHREKPA